MIATYITFAVFREKILKNNWSHGILAIVMIKTKKELDGNNNNKK